MADRFRGKKGVGIPYKVAPLDITREESLETEEAGVQSGLGGAPLPMEEFFPNYLRALYRGFGSWVHKDLQEGGGGSRWSELNTRLLSRPLYTLRESVVTGAGGRIRLLANFILREKNALPQWKINMGELRESARPEDGEWTGHKKPVTGRLLAFEVHRGMFEEDLLARLGTSKYLGAAFTLLGEQTLRYLNEKAIGRFLNLSEEEWSHQELLTFGRALRGYFLAVHNQAFDDIKIYQKKLFEDSDFVRKTLILLKRVQEVERGEARIPLDFSFLWNPFPGQIAGPIGNKEIIEPVIFLLRMLGRYVVWRYIQQYTSTLTNGKRRIGGPIVSGLSWSEDLLRSATKFLRLARNSVIWGIAAWANQGIVDSPRIFVSEAFFSTALKKEELEKSKRLFEEMVEQLRGGGYTVLDPNGTVLWRNSDEWWSIYLRALTPKQHPDEVQKANKLLERDYRIALLALLGVVKLEFGLIRIQQKTQNVWEQRIEALRGHLASLVPYVASSVGFEVIKEGEPVPQIGDSSYWAFRTRPDAILYPQWFGELDEDSKKANSVAPGAATIRTSHITGDQSLLRSVVAIKSSEEHGGEASVGGAGMVRFVPKEGWLKYLAAHIKKVPDIVLKNGKPGPLEIIIDEYKVRMNGENGRVKDFVRLQHRRLFLLVLTLYSMDRKPREDFNAWLKREDNILRQLDKVGFRFKLRLLLVDMGYNPKRATGMIQNILHTFSYSAGELVSLSQKVAKELATEIIPTKIREQKLLESSEQKDTTDGQ